MRAAVTGPVTIPIFASMSTEELLMRMIPFVWATVIAGCGGASSTLGPGSPTLGSPTPTTNRPEAIATASASGVGSATPSVAVSAPTPSAKPPLIAAGLGGEAGPPALSDAAKRTKIATWSTRGSPRDPIIELYGDGTVWWKRAAWIFVPSVTNGISIWQVAMPSPQTAQSPPVRM